MEFYKDSVDAITIDITDNVQKAVEKGVMSIPTIIFLNDDKEIKRLSGVVSKDKIELAIENL